ncbi:MAG TPA: alpha/beta fold hydrolase [Chloroflexia bacterium]|nr:alpha/beta fold hydrolase [Chloroflexia bacterium]
MATIHSESLWVQGRHCHAWIGGPDDAPPVLLLHGGLGDSLLHWHRNFADLSADFRMLAPDLPGFGRTAPLPHPSYPAYAAWAAAFCDTAGAGHGLTVVGNSMGAVVARVFAATSPARVARLVLVDGGRPFAPTGLAGLALRVPPLRDALISILRRRATARRALPTYLADPSLLSPALRRRLVRGIHSYIRVQRAILAAPPVPPHALAVACPVQVIWGAEDRLGRPTLAVGIAAELRADPPILIPGAGHMPMLEQPAAFAGALRGFMAGR